MALANWIPPHVLLPTHPLKVEFIGIRGIDKWLGDVDTNVNDFDAGDAAV